MKPGKKEKLFYIVMSLICGIMAVLILVTANANNWGGLVLQQTMAVILAISSVAFSTKLVPPSGR